jgi:hypothetical protein
VELQSPSLDSRQAISTTRNYRPLTLTLSLSNRRRALATLRYSIMINYASGSALTVGDRAYSLKRFHSHQPTEERLVGRASTRVGTSSTSIRTATLPSWPSCSKASITTAGRECLRRRYRPTQMRMLFVGEAPPAPGRLLYRGIRSLTNLSRHFCHHVSRPPRN